MLCILHCFVTVEPEYCSDKSSKVYLRILYFKTHSVCLFVDSVSLPYDHTYQHIFQYGIYTKLRSSLLPLSITWHNVPGGIDTAWVRGHWCYVYVDNLQKGA